jgi:hypothetical protein
LADIAAALPAVWPWGEVAAVCEVASRLAHTFPAHLVEAAIWKVVADAAAQGHLLVDLEQFTLDRALPQLLYAQVIKTVRRRRVVRVCHRAVFGTVEAVQQVLAAHGWQSNTAFVERLNLTIRQHGAAVG